MLAANHPSIGQRTLNLEWAIVVREASARRLGSPIGQATREGSTRRTSAAERIGALLSALGLRGPGPAAHGERQGDSALPV